MLLFSYFNDILDIWRSGHYEVKAGEKPLRSKVTSVERRTVGRNKLFKGNFYLLSNSLHRTQLGNSFPSHKNTNYYFVNFSLTSSVFLTNFTKDI